MKFINWFFIGIADQFVDFLGKMLDLYERIDIWWELKSSEKKKNIRNNFQKCILILIIIAVKAYDIRTYNTDISRINNLQNVTQKNLNNCIKAEVERLKIENTKYEKIREDFHQAQIKIELLKQELKNDKK